MAKRDMISGLFLMIISLTTCVMAHGLGLGAGSNPGPGFAAFGIAFLLGLMSLYLFLKGMAQMFKERSKGEAPAPILWKKPMLILIVLAGYGIFFDLLGFPLSTFLLMMLLIWVFGRQRLPLALTVSILTVASSYTLFVIAFGLPLPLGSIWYMLGG